MTSVPVNDENRGVCPGKKPSESDIDFDIFNLDQPTGRPSILRQSQAENLPNKSAIKGIKVCFQTPRRDPVTKRIVSPTKSLKMTSLDECTKALMSMRLTTTEVALCQGNETVDGPMSDVSSFPDEEIPIQTKGGYQLDFDNLDAMNPFLGSLKMTLSPRPCESVEEPVPPEQNEPNTGESYTPEVTTEEPAAALDETLPFTPSAENSLADGSADMRSTDSSLITMTVQNVSISEEEHLSLSLDQDQALTNSSAFKDSPLPTRASQPVQAVLPQMKPDPAVSPTPSQPAAESMSPPISAPPKEDPVKLVGLDQDQALTNASAFDDAPLPAKGSYSFDFDDLDSVNPFQMGGSKMQNSPVLGRKLLCDPCDTVGVPQPVQETPVLPEVKPNPVVSLSPTPSKPPAESMSSPISAPPKEHPVKLVGLDQDQALTNSSAFEEAPLPAKGSYSFDFDDLDSVNPFQMGGSKMQNSPVLGRKLLCDPCDTVGVPQPVQETPVLPEVKPNPVVSLSPTPSKPPAESMSPPISVPPKEDPVKLVGLDQDQALTNSSAFEEAPLPAKGSYSLNFDDLDSVNPFQTGGSKMQNSPVLGRKLPCDPPAPVEGQESEMKGMEACDTVGVPQPVQKMPILPEVPNPVVSLSPTPSKPPAESMSPPVSGPPKENPVKLEFNFDDGGEVKRKPPKKFGKRPSGVKATKAVPEKKDSASKSSPVKPAADPVADVVSKGAYSFDFDKFDDPNFNPFGSNMKMSDLPKSSVKSSPKGVKSSPQDEAPVPEKEVAPAEQMTEPVEREMQSSARDCSPSTDVTPSQQLPTGTINHLESTMEPDQHVLKQNPQNCLSEPSEEFVSGTVFMSNDFDGQMDYLEQFGSSTFKESALRKQSLYLKFDPLLRESPKKAGGTAALNNFPRTAAFASRLDTQRTGAKENVCEQKMGCFDFLDVTAPVAGPLVQNRPLLHVTPFSQPVNSEDAIFEVLKYTQKDMDAAIARTEAVAKQREDQWEAKYEALSQENCEIRKIIPEFENTMAQILAEQQKEKDAAQATLCKALQEKEQVSMDLNVLERSFSDLFKRLDKYKEVFEGYKKNEETLKKCAQDYLARIKKEEQRYQMLKVQAEEKIKQANGEIAEVRSKLKAESSVLHAQLRREQLKVQSLEKNLDYKVKEIEELSKLCDELIVKVETR